MYPVPKNYEWKEFWRTKYQNHNKHIAMYPCTKFQSVSIWDQICPKAPEGRVLRQTQSENILF